MPQINKRGALRYNNNNMPKVKQKDPEWNAFDIIEAPDKFQGDNIDW